MRKAMFVLVIVFVLLAGVAPVQAQGVGLLGGGYRPSSWEGWMYYLQGDQVSMLQADNLAMVDRMMGMGRRAQLRRVTDDLAWNGAYYGLNTQRGFYPLARCNKGQRIGRYAADVGIGTLIGVIAGGKKGAAYGAGLGTAVAVREDLQCWGVRNNKVKVVGLPDDDDEMMIVDPPTGGPQTPDRPVNGWNQRLREQANSGNLLFGSQRGCMEQGMATLKNEGRNPISVYQDGTHYVDLLPRRSECGDPRASYEAEVLTMVVEGYAGTMDTARRKPEGRDGLVLVWR